VSGHVFVDETKHRGYLLVASAVPPGDLDPLRKLIRGLILPGQRRLHMKNENDQRKRSITAAITNSDVRATIYTAERRYRTERDSRAACLQALVADIATRGDTTILGFTAVIEVDSANGPLGSGTSFPLGNVFELWSGMWCTNLALDALMPTFDAAASGRSEAHGIRGRGEA